MEENPYRRAAEIYYECYNQIFAHFGLDSNDLSEEDQLKKKSIITSLRPVNLVTPTIYRVKRTYVKSDITSKEEFDIDDENNFLNGENICKYAGYVDEENPDSLMLIFASNYTIRLLHACRVIFLDGTFKMAPKLWKQILIINCEIDEKLSLPVLFGLLPDKATVTYQACFQKIKESFEELELGQLLAIQAMADFEVALRNAWEAVFEHTPMKNCLFHFDKVILITCVCTTANDNYKCLYFAGSDSKITRGWAEVSLQQGQIRIPWQSCTWITVFSVGSTGPCR